MKKINETTLLNAAGTYRMLQPFASVEELNANTTAIRELYADEMTPATYDVLDVLHRYACKFPGVCFLSKTKIASLLGIVRRTVQRACDKLESLGVIKQHTTRRAGGDTRQSSNAIVFLSVETADIAEPVTPDVTPECRTVNTPQNAPEKTKTLYTDDTDAREESEISGQGKDEVKDESKAPFDPTDKSQLAPSLPDGWYEVASPYAEDFNDLYAITGALFKGKHGTTLLVEDYIAEFGEVLRKAWIGVKNGKVKASAWHAYLYAGFKRTAAGIQSQLDRAPLFRLSAELLDPSMPLASPRDEFIDTENWAEYVG